MNLVGRPLSQEEQDRIVLVINDIYGVDAASAGELAHEPWFGPDTPAVREAVVDALVDWETGDLEVPVSRDRFVRVRSEQVEALAGRLAITRDALVSIVTAADGAGLWDPNLGELFWQPLVGLLRMNSDYEVLDVVDADVAEGGPATVTDVANLAERYRDALETFADPGLAMVATVDVERAERVLEDLTSVGVVDGEDAGAIQWYANSAGFKTTSEWRDSLISSGDVRFVFVSDDLVSASPDWLSGSLRRWPQRDGFGLDIDACTFDGVFLGGRVQVVDSRADFSVRVADGWLADIQVSESAFAPSMASCGVWAFVSSSPDFTVRWVDQFEDFSIAFE